MARISTCAECFEEFTLGVSGSFNPMSEQNECDSCRGVTRCHHDGAILDFHFVCPLCNEKFAPVMDLVHAGKA